MRDAVAPADWLPEAAKPAVLPAPAVWRSAPAATVVETAAGTCPRAPARRQPKRCATSTVINTAYASTATPSASVMKFTFRREAASSGSRGDGWSGGFHSASDPRSDLSEEAALETAALSATACVLFDDSAAEIVSADIAPVDVVSADIVATGAVPADVVPPGMDPDARSRLLSTRRESASSVRSSRSPKPDGNVENASNTPASSPFRSTGRIIAERIPRIRQASTSARGSFSVSSQRCTVRVATHAPDSPEAVSSLAPNCGALLPVLARQTHSPPRSSTIAAPLAPVARQACSTISFSTICNASSAEISGETRPPPCSANFAASSPKSHSPGVPVSETAPTSEPLSGEAEVDFTGSDPNIGLCAMREEELTENSASVAEFRPKSGGCQYRFSPSLPHAEVFPKNSESPIHHEIQITRQKPPFVPQVFANRVLMPLALSQNDKKCQSNTRPGVLCFLPLRAREC